MKFLIAMGGHGLALGDKVAFLYSSDFGVSCRQPVWREASGVVIISSHPPAKPMTEGGAMMLWDGAPINGDVAFSPLLPVPDSAARMNRYIQNLQQDDGLKAWSGIFGCAHVSPDGDCVVAADPLSQYAFFYASVGTTTLVSNSLHLIEKVCEQLGEARARDFGAAAYEGAFGLGAWTKTGLTDVNKFPPNHYLRYSQGQVRFCRQKSRAFSRRSDRTEYERNLALAVEKQKNNALALKNALPGQGLVVDLSGGKDTRLMMGAQLAVQNENFHVFLGGVAGGPDQQSASRLVNHYNLDAVSYLSNLEPSERISAERAARRASYRFMGTSNNCHADLGDRQLLDVAQVRGGSSEGRTRAFFSPARGKRRRKMLRYGREIQSERRGFFGLARETLGLGAEAPQTVLLAKLISRGKRCHHLFTKDFLQEAYEYIAANIDWLLDQEVPLDNLADTFYIFDRGWRHCGFPVQVMNDSKTTFEPLNELSLLEAHFSLSEDDRQNARLAFDLMEAYQVEGLTNIPFEGSDWPDVYLSSPDRLNRRSWAQISTKTHPPQSILGPSGEIDNMYNLGISEFLKQVRPLMLGIAEALPSHHQCWDYLKRETLIQMLSSDEPIPKHVVAVLIRLLHGLIWVSHEEERCPLG